MNKKLFNPNGIGLKNDHIFGLDTNYEDADFVIVPVPWEVTVSYRSGTASAPKNILDTSSQIDLFHEDFPKLWQQGIYMLPIDGNVLAKNQELSKISRKVINDLESGVVESDPAILKSVSVVNRGCDWCVNYVKEVVLKCLKDQKIVGVLGGEHGVSEGAIKAFSNIYDSFGVLQFDAHMDLRKDYEGFTHSHASVMRNIIDLPQISNLVQVGVRDFCEDEFNYANKHQKITTFTDTQLKKILFEGQSWQSLCDKIIESLPEKIYITLDIDVLNPALCPSTGTPVPGGLQYEQLFYLISKTKKTKKQIIGFDLVEVAGAPDTINTIVGARALYGLLGAVAKYQKNLHWHMSANSPIKNKVSNKF
jgi:agmatinase